MKSSSQFFPVALLSAEYKEGIYEDVYSLKPNNSEDTTVEIALVRLHSEQDSLGHPLLMVHDAFSNHWQWLDYRVGGVAGALVKAGYDVWLMDWRGHGLSARNQRPTLNTLNNMAQFDLPPVIQFIEEKTARSPTVVSQGYGCEIALQHAVVNQYQANLVLLDPLPLWPSRLFWIPGVKAWKRLCNVRRRWYRSERGEEVEPAALFRQLLRRQGVFGRWRAYDHELMKPRLKEHSAAMYWVMSADKPSHWLKRLDPVSTHLLLGAKARDWLALIDRISATHSLKKPLPTGRVVR